MKAYELLDSPEKWTKGVAARDKYNKQVIVEAEEACKFCVYGALRKCYGGAYSLSGLTGIALDNMEKIMNKLNLPTAKELFKWNDKSKYEEVISILKELDI